MKEKVTSKRVLKELKAAILQLATASKLQIVNHPKLTKELRHLEDIKVLLKLVCFCIACSR